MNNSQIRLNKRIISSKNIIDNLNIFIDIIFNKIIKEKSNLSIYAQLCKKINALILKRNINNIKEEYLQNIYLNECLKRINNKEFINNIKTKFENKKNNILDLINFISELVLVKLIKKEDCINIIIDLHKKYEKNNDNMKYIYLEGFINLFNITILEMQKTEKDFHFDNLIEEIVEKLKKIVQDKNINNILKQKINDIIEKKKTRSKKQEDKIIIKDIFDKMLLTKSEDNKIIIEEKEFNNKNKDEEENKISNLKNIIININNINNKDNTYKEKQNNLNTIKDIFNFCENNEQKNIKKIEEKNNGNNNTNKKNNKAENNEKKENNNNAIILDEPQIKKDKKYNNIFGTLIPNKLNVDNNSENEAKKNNINNLFTNKVEELSVSSTKNSQTVTHKKKQKSKRKAKSTEKRVLPSKYLINADNQKEEIKEVIKEDFENYLKFLEKEGIKKKEDIYEELNDLYNWKIIDDLIMKKKVKLEEIIKVYIDICKNKNDIINSNDDVFKYNEYIKTIIEYYSKYLSNNQIEILHLNMIEIYMVIDNIVNNKNGTLNMYEIMGNLLYILLKNKLYYMKDLNIFIDENKDTQINIAKVVKYTILASGNSFRQYHNDFKYTKLFNNNDIFTIYVTNELNDIKKK